MDAPNGTGVFSKPITELIQKRFSCRDYLPQLVDAQRQQLLQAFAEHLRVGPFNTAARFQLLAASVEDTEALKGLGTYGTIRHPMGFLAGAIRKSAKDLEAYGYLLEKYILYATSLNLGTCWLGGAFRRSAFASAISPQADEHMPAVAAVGAIGDLDKARNAIERRIVRSDSRLPWEQLFFDGRFGAPLSRVAAGAYAVPLEMVRRAPSAHNKQPWRILSDETGWHFYLQRTPDLSIQLTARIMKIADLQRIDMGIAMCHFDLASRELGLDGRWVICEPQADRALPRMEYIVSWLPG